MRQRSNRSWWRVERKTEWRSDTVGEEKTTAPDQTAHQTGLITSVPSGIQGGGSPTHWPTAAVSSNHYVSKQFVSSQIGVGWDPPR